jgi:8-oxo-dGTP pyrophosphatase MutT (NUDIX family)
VFPGGRLDKGENFLEACLREVKEEIGVEVTSINNKFYLRSNSVEVEPLIAYESIYPNLLSQGLPK